MTTELFLDGKAEKTHYQTQAPSKPRLLNPEAEWTIMVGQDDKQKIEYMIIKWCCLLCLYSFESDSWSSPRGKWTQTKTGENGKNKWVKQYTMIITCCWQKFRNQNWRYGLWNNHFGLNTFTGFFSYFFRDHPNFLGISGTFSGVSTISGVSQGFQESLATLGTVKKFRTRLCYTCDNPRHYIKRPGKCLLSIKLISGWCGLFQEDRCW